MSEKSASDLVVDGINYIRKKRNRPSLNAIFEYVIRENNDISASQFKNTVLNLIADGVIFNKSSVGKKESFYVNNSVVENSVLSERSVDTPTVINRDDLQTPVKSLQSQEEKDNVFLTNPVLPTANCRNMNEIVDNCIEKRILQEISPFTERLENIIQSYNHLIEKHERLMNTNNILREQNQKLIMTEANVVRLEVEVGFLKGEIETKNELIKSLCSKTSKDNMLSPPAPFYNEENVYNSAVKAKQNVNNEQIFDSNKDVAGKKTLWQDKIWSPVDNNVSPLDNYVSYGDHASGQKTDNPFVIPRKNSKGNRNDGNNSIPLLKNRFELPDTGIEGSTGNKKIYIEHGNISKNKSFRSTTILGDSTIKDLKAYKMKKFLPKGNKLYVKPFSGATTECMEHHVKPSLKYNNDLYILHTGTNDLRSPKSAADIAENIIKLAGDIKNKDNDVIISGITERNDEWNDKGIDVNEHLFRKCKTNNIYFLNNSNISRDVHLNGSGLHLNYKGVIQLSNNFLDCIKL